MLISYWRWSFLVFLQLDSGFSFGRHSASPYCSVALYFLVEFVLIFTANWSVVRCTSTALETETVVVKCVLWFVIFFCWCSVNVEFFPTLGQPLYLYRSIIVGFFKACCRILDSVRIPLLFLKSLVAICNVSFVNAVFGILCFYFGLSAKIINAFAMKIMGDLF